MEKIGKYQSYKVAQIIKIAHDNRIHITQIG